MPGREPGSDGPPPAGTAAAPAGGRSRRAGGHGGAALAFGAAEDARDGVDPGEQQRQENTTAIIITGLR
jgi:hypothetical protein